VFTGVCIVLSSRERTILCLESASALMKKIGPGLHPPDARLDTGGLSLD
jgi:hypothetical protein